MQTQNFVADVSYMKAQFVVNILHSLCLTERTIPLRRLGLRGNNDLEPLVFPALLRTIVCFASTLTALEICATLYNPTMEFAALMSTLCQIKNLDDVVVRLESGSTRNATGVAVCPVCMGSAMDNLPRLMFVRRMLFDFQHFHPKHPLVLRFLRG